MSAILITVRCGDAGNDPVTIGWTGLAWVPVFGHPQVARSMCGLANVVSQETLIGEHHLPPGVMMAQNVAAKLGGKVTACPKWADALPPGAVA